MDAKRKKLDFFLTKLVVGNSLPVSLVEEKEFTEYSKAIDPRNSIFRILRFFGISDKPNNSF